jgi:hypothetical protein
MQPQRKITVYKKCTRLNIICDKNKKKFSIGHQIFNLIFIFRVTRIQHGPEFRGHRPVLVQFVNYNDKARRVITDGFSQGVTKRCRLSLLTNSGLVYESKCGGMGGGGCGCGVSANEYSCPHHVTWSPDKLWRSTSIFIILPMDLVNSCLGGCAEKAQAVEGSQRQHISEKQSLVERPKSLSTFSQCTESRMLV